MCQRGEQFWFNSKEDGERKGKAVAKLRLKMEPSYLNHRVILCRSLQERMNKPLLKKNLGSQALVTEA